MKYPTRKDYETFVKNPKIFVLDRILQTGTPLTQSQNPQFLLQYSGGKAVVFVIETSTKKYALKCWIEALGNLQNRYKELDQYLQQYQLPYFVDFSFNEQGILVNGQRYPTVRMGWVEGINLKKFIADNFKEPNSIRKLADKFLEMVKTLHQNNISHGDLQHGNIMIKHNGEICLIDYDSCYVPNLAGEQDDIKGLPGYQHPYRKDLANLHPKADYFSELVIYLSLLAIAEKPTYWQTIEKEERLLFSENDLISPGSSKIFSELNKLSPEICYFTVELEKFCTEKDIKKLESLESLVAKYTGPYLDYSHIRDNFIPSAPSPRPVVIVDTKPSTSDDIWTKKFGKTDIWAEKFGIPKSVSSSKPVVILNTKLSTSDDIWAEKFGVPKSKPSPEPRQKQVPVIHENIWDKFRKSISLIWKKFIKWFGG